MWTRLCIGLTLANPKSSVSPESARKPPKPVMKNPMMPTATYDAPISSDAPAARLLFPMYPCTSLG